jgi:type II secretory ATPase GspE/PulE/Tfp pilus assembly ATPase PilB-like protein
VEDLIEAASVEEAQEKVRRMGYFPTQLTEVNMEQEESILDLIHQLEQDPDLGSCAGGRAQLSIELETLAEIMDAAPVRKLLNMAMLLAIKDKASDIYFEPFEDE